jgi:hypothetical protein
VLRQPLFAVVPARCTNAGPVLVLCPLISTALLNTKRELKWVDFASSLYTPLSRALMSCELLRYLQREACDSCLTPACLNLPSFPTFLRRAGEYLKVILSTNYFILTITRGIPELEGPGRSLLVYLINNTASQG